MIDGPEELYTYPSVYDVNGSFPRKITHRYIWAALFTVDTPFFDSGDIRLKIIKKYEVDIPSQVIGKCLVSLCQTKYLNREPVHPSSHHFKYRFKERFIRIKNRWSVN